MQSENEGCVELFDNKLRSGDYIDYAVEYYRQNFKPLVLMTLMFHVPLTFLIYYLTDYGNLMYNIVGWAENPSAEAPLLQILTVYIGFLILGLYNSIFVHILSFAVMKHTFERVVTGVSLKIKKAFRHGLKRFGWFLVFVFGLGLLSVMISQVFSLVLMVPIIAIAKLNSAFIAIVLLIIFLAAIVLGIYIYFRLYFIPHEINLDMIDPLKAIKASWALTKKKFWRIFWPVIFGAVFTQTIPSAISSLTSFLQFDNPLANRIIAAVIASCAALIYPCFHILTTLIFIQLKNENGDIKLLLKVRNLVKDESEKITFGQK